LTIPEVSWSSTGGEIDRQGRFIADATGEHQVLAKAGDVEGAAEIRVIEHKDDGGNGDRGGDGERGDRKTIIKGFGWKGSVTPQKWMNFYTKVLSSLVSTPGLKLEVRFEVMSADPANEAKIEATKAALRELGLSEEVEIHAE
jgi:hypothetical protein